MTQEQILEGNKVIADFMGMKWIIQREIGGCYLVWVYDRELALNYDEDWNLLAPAVKTYRDSVKVADVHGIRVYDAWHGMIIYQIFEALVNAIKARNNGTDN